MARKFNVDRALVLYQQHEIMRLAFKHHQHHHHRNDKFHDHSIMRVVRNAQIYHKLSRKEEEGLNSESDVTI